MTEQRRYGVILAYMGGPEKPGEVRRFLSNLFNDRHILNIPQPIRFLISRMISYSRARTAIEHYNEIGGGSPLKRLTSDQAEKLHDALKSKGFDVSVRTGYSYINPFIRETVASYKEDPPEKIIAVPLYPQNSITTYGSIADDFTDAAEKQGLANRLTIVPPYYDHEIHTGAGAELLKKALAESEPGKKTRVIFTAHALPQSIIDKGDPYRAQIEKTVSLLLEKVPVDDYVLSFQSKIGPVKWMKPSTVKTVQKAGRERIEQLVVVPIGFTCDHVETLHELDIELKELAHESGIKKFIRAGVFNSHPLFIELLSELVIREINA